MKELMLILLLSICAPAILLLALALAFIVTHEVEYAVDPEQVLGFEALIRDQLDDCWHRVREKYLDVIVKANYYPDGAQTAAGIVGAMLDTNVQKNLEMLHNKMKEFEEEST